MPSASWPARRLRPPPNAKTLCGEVAWTSPCAAPDWRLGAPTLSWKCEVMRSVKSHARRWHHAAPSSGLRHAQLAASKKLHPCPALRKSEKRSVGQRLTEVFQRTASVADNRPALFDWRRARPVLLRHGVRPRRAERLQHEPGLRELTLLDPVALHPRPAARLAGRGIRPFERKAKPRVVTFE